MCLDSVDSKIKKHNVGYKVFQRAKDGFYTDLYPSGPYSIGKNKYDAKKGQRELPSVWTGLETYIAGFHYYLKMKDAKAKCASHEVVVRIKVENLLATGKQYRLDAGVSRFMILDRVVFDRNKQIELLERQNKQEFLAACQEEIPSKMLHFAKLYKLNYNDVLSEDAKKMADLVSSSMDTLIQYVSFIDLMPRSSQIFRFFTSFHLQMSSRKGQYSKKYLELVTKDRMLDPPIVQLFKKYSYMKFIKYAQDMDTMCL